MEGISRFSTTAGGLGDSGVFGVYAETDGMLQDGESGLSSRKVLKSREPLKSVQTAKSRQRRQTVDQVYNFVQNGINKISRL